MQKRAKKQGKSRKKQGGRKQQNKQESTLLSCSRGQTCAACLNVCRHVERHLDVGTFVADHHDIEQARKRAGKARELLDALGLTAEQEDKCVMVGGYRLGTNRLLDALGLTRKLTPRQRRVFEWLKEHPEVLRRRRPVRRRPGGSQVDMLPGPGSTSQATRRAAPPGHLQG